MKKILLLTITCSISIGSLFAQLDRKGIQAAYKFDGNYKDSTKNQRHLLWSSTSFTSDRNNTPNSAVRFEGDGGFMIGYVGSHANFTIGYWFKPETQIDPYPHMFDYGNYQFRGMIMAGSIYNSSDRHHVYCGTNFPSEFVVKSPNAVSYNSWQHIAYVFNDSSKKIQLYIDGSLANETTITNSLSPQDSIIMFGRPKSGPDSETTTSGYKGVLDDIYIFSRALNAQEITDMKNGSFINLGVPGNNDVTNPEEIRIYPNPSREGYFNIEVKNPNTEIKSIKIFDLAGKLVSITYDANTVNTSDLSAGTYIIQVNSSDNLILGTERIVIE